MFLIIICPLSLRQLIYNYPEQLFADAGLMAIEHADFEGIERLALVLGEPNTRVNTAGGVWADIGRDQCLLVLYKRWHNWENALIWHRALRLIVRLTITQIVSKHCESSCVWCVDV